MTDYEMIDIFFVNLNLLFTILMSYVSIVSAFLVVGYLVSAKLKPSMVSIIIGLFTLVSFVMTFALNRTAQTILDMAEEIRNAVHNGTSSLGWWNITDPEILLQGPMITFTSIMILAYIGAVIFFFHQRGVGLAKS